MIFVKGGTFMMGSNEKESLWREDPIHQVEVSDFYIGKYSVIQSLWKAIMGEEHNPSFFIGGQRPVESVSWEDANTFIDRLNQHPNIQKMGAHYRLPFEAEWEYAARGGNLCKGYTYAGGDKLHEVAWFNENSHKETKPVGLKLPNELDIFDMAGNVWEWCQDWYADDYYEICHQQGKVKNPQGPSSGSRRVNHGGGWNDLPQDCRSASRCNDSPKFRAYNLGFRLVCVP